MLIDLFSADKDLGHFPYQSAHVKSVSLACSTVPYNYKLVISVPVPFSTPLRVQGIIYMLDNRSNARSRPHLNGMAFSRCSVGRS